MQTTNAKFHVGLHVSDVNKSTEFYTDFLNSKPVKRKSDYSKFETDQIVLSLIHHPTGAKSGFGHFGIRIDSDEVLAENRTRLQSKGYELREEDQVSCCYALQNKFWVKDPDGHEWELYHFLEDVNQLQEIPVVENAENACCSTDCCN